MFLKRSLEIMEKFSCNLGVRVARLRFTELTMYLIIEIVFLC